MLFLFAFNVPLPDGTSMLWVIILQEYESLTHKPRSRWDRVMLQYAVIAGLIQVALRLAQILDFAISKSPPRHNRNTSMLYDWCDIRELLLFHQLFKLGKNAMWWKLDLLLWPREQETEFPVEACRLSQTQEDQTEQIHPQTFDDPFFDSTGMIYMHWVPTGQTVNKEYYVEVLREFRKRFRRKMPALFKSGQWHFHQDNASVHNSILVTDYLTKTGIKTVPQPPYRLNLAPCDSWLFPKLRGCCYETIEEMKEAVTKVIDTLTQENFHGIFQKLL